MNLYKELFEKYKRNDNKNIVECYDICGKFIKHYNELKNDEKEKRVKVVLQGACNGCPSSTFTLKSGIENMLKDMLNDKDIIVEALNG